MKTILSVVLLIALSCSLSAQTKMELTNKQILLTKSINQPIDTVWKRWTTHEGLKTFFGRDNKIELIPGGAFEIYFLPDKPAGSRGSEGCKVLSFLPGKYFSFSWIAPPQFEELRKSEHKTWVVVSFEAIADNQTEVTLTHLGWPNDDRWMPVFDYFSKGWTQILDNLSKNHESEIALNQQNRRVTGIGGIFFKCKDAKKLKEWYQTHLGLVTDKYGTNFEWRQSADPSKKGYTQWSPFSETTKYFEPSTRDFMINYRVINLTDLVEQLKKEGVTIVDKIESYDYGKFVHILDLEGNKVELWEPDDVVYDKIEGGRTK